MGAGAGSGLTTGVGFVGADGGETLLVRGDSFGAMVGTVGLLTGAGAGIGIAGTVGFTRVGDADGSVWGRRFFERTVSGFGVVGTIG